MRNPSESPQRVLKFVAPDDLPRGYAFGTFTFDPHDRVLSRGGESVPLPPKAAELLLLFVQSHGRVLSKETLIQALWPDTTVEEGNLTQTIFVLRKVLGADDGGEAYVETLPRRGYRFAVAVRTVTDAAGEEMAPAFVRSPVLRVVLLIAACAAFLVASAAVLLRSPARVPVGAVEMIPATISAAAREAYLKGRHHWNLRTRSDFDRAVEYFRLATEEEPRFALAWAGLADAYNFRGQAPRAKTAATRALEIDPACAQAHAALGNAALFHDFDWATADRSFARAVELDPDYATTRQWRAFLLAAQRRFPEAREEIERARALDPLSRIITTDVGVIDYYSGDYERAIASFQRALELDPSFEQAHLMLIASYLRLGRIAEAEREHAAMPSVLFEVEILIARGERERARSILENSAPGSITNFGRARAYATLGEVAAAVSWLDRAYAARDGDLAMLHADPGFERIRQEPAYRAFLRARKLEL